MELKISHGDTILDPEIMSMMLQETFGESSMPEHLKFSPVPETFKALKEKKKISESEEHYVDPDLVHLLSPIADSISLYLGSIFQKILPGDSRIFLRKNLSFSYKEMDSLSAERSYFSLLYFSNPNSIWLMHVERRLAEGLARQIRTDEWKKQGKSRKWTELREADTAIYFDIGAVLRQFFEVISKSWSDTTPLKFKSFKHTLQPGFLKVVDAEDLFIVQEFVLQHRDVPGSIHIAIPYSLILNIFGSRL